MTWFDWRKFTERRINFCMMLITLIGTCITLWATKYTVDKTDNYNQKSFCIDKVAPKIERISANLYELPKLVTGCGIDSSTYCKQARSKVDQTKFLAFEIRGLLVEESRFYSATSNLITLLDIAKNKLNNTDDSEQHSTDLTNIASNINSQRSDFSNLNIQELICHQL